jgi:hypothetical protein
MGPEAGWARSRGVPLGDRIGQAPLGPAATADSEMLGLLALTPELRRLDPRGALYLDTETTGLGGAGTIAFLVGMAWIDWPERALRVEQWLLPSPAHEAPLLRAVEQRLEACSFVVTYNGKSFDLPLLRARLLLGGLGPLPERPQLDLLHVVRRVHRHRRWRKSLGSVERQVLGFDRGPDVAGADVAQRYHHYLRSRDPAGLTVVVAHNERDVLSMVALVGLYGEPLERLDAADLASMARTILRAGDAAAAAAMADLAVARGGGAGALRVRAELAKARGDKGQALGDFERLAVDVDDPTIRLELSKLYEHHVRDPLRALAVASRGTGEDPSALGRRVARLQRKLGSIGATVLASRPRLR